MGNKVIDALEQAWGSSLEAAARFLPRLLAMFIFVVVGWFVALLLGMVVGRVLRSMLYAAVPA
jgi:hypothetical protein